MWTILVLNSESSVVLGLGTDRSKSKHHHAWLCHHAWLVPVLSLDDSELRTCVLGMPSARELPFPSCYETHSLQMAHTGVLGCSICTPSPHFALPSSISIPSLFGSSSQPRSTPHAHSATLYVVCLPVLKVSPWM